MAFFNRIRCHFCGTRSPFSRSSGVSEFQCVSCEAVNYLDSRGNIIDTPATAVVAASQPQYRREQSQPRQAFTQPNSLRQQETPSFCTTCLHNQRFVMEALGNYLPDEDDPEYAKYEAALPQYKQELEKRYPQVCRKCAPKAQGLIHQADYYAGTQNVGKIARDTTKGARRRRSRDDRWKWTMRRVMNVVGLMVYAGLTTQVAWHVYGLLLAGFWRRNGGDDYYSFHGLDLEPPDCIGDARRMRFSPPCEQLLASYVPRALLVSAALIWYNPRLADWWHHTHRIESISGQTEHFRLQLLTLAVRGLAYWKLSDPTLHAWYSSQQITAAHGFILVFLAVMTWLGHRTVNSVRFKLKQRMMPRPEQQNVLGAFAGPGDENYERQASSIPPSHLLTRDHTSPFPIANLAPKQHNTRSRGAPAAMPSPPPSDETDDEYEGDAMDVDTMPPAQVSQMPGVKNILSYRPLQAQKRGSPANTRSLYNHSQTQGLGWSGMRDSLFGIEDGMTLEQRRQQQEAEQKAKLKFQPPVEPSPFRGRLPQAPMSMERKLRNPPSQVSFRKAPLSKQQDFLQQMRAGIEDGKAFARQQEAAKQRDTFGLLLEDTDDDMPPAKIRPGSRDMELKPSRWHLPADAKASTGLEDLFGGSFKLDDPKPASAATSAQGSTATWTVGWGVGIALLALIVAFGMDIGGFRRESCLWLYHRLEQWGI